MLRPPSPLLQLKGGLGQNGQTHRHDEPPVPVPDSDELREPILNAIEHFWDAVGDALSSVS